MKNLNAKELNNINGGGINTLQYTHKIGCGNGDGINYNPKNHGPLKTQY